MTPQEHDPLVRLRTIALMALIGFLTSKGINVDPQFQQVLGLLIGVIIGWIYDKLAFWIKSNLNLDIKSLTSDPDHPEPK